MPTRLSMITDSAHSTGNSAGNHPTRSIARSNQRGEGRGGEAGSADSRWGAAAAAEGTARGWRAGTGRGRPACTSPRCRGSPWRRPAPGSPGPARTPRSTRRSATTTPSPPPEPEITSLPGGILGAAVGASLSLWCRLCARSREAVRRRTRPRWWLRCGRKATRPRGSGGRLFL